MKPFERMFSGGYSSPLGWVVVVTAPDRMAGGMLEAFLKDAGIPVMMQRPAVFPYLGSGGEHRLLVPEDREDEARGLLSQIWPAEEDPDE